MYYCENCKQKFKIPQKVCEKHGFSNPPYEESFLCPFCNSTDFKEITRTHCRCCGALLIRSNSEYCSSACQSRGEKLWKEQAEKFKIEYDSPINVILREIKESNLRNGTDYSYGQYVSLKDLQRRNKK